MRKLIFCGIVAAAFAGVAFGFTPTRHTNVLTRAGVTYVQRGALGSADYVATNVAMSAADVNALPNNETQLLANPAFTNAVRAIGGGGGGGSVNYSVVTNIAGVVTSNVVTKAYVEGLGVSGGNVLHYDTPTESFTETPSEVVGFIESEKPLYCIVDKCKWYKTDNIVSQTFSSVFFYSISMSCANTKKYGDGSLDSPSYLAIDVVPSQNAIAAEITEVKLLRDNYFSLASSDGLSQFFANASRISYFDSSRSGDQYAYVTNALSKGNAYVFRFGNPNVQNSKNRIYTRTYTPLTTDASGYTNYNFSSLDESGILYKCTVKVKYSTQSVAYIFNEVGGYIPFNQKYDSSLQLRRYQVSPSSHGIGAYQFVGGKFYAKNWTDYMLYDDSGDIIQTTSLPWYLEHTYVPNTRKINGQALSNDITIATMDYQAMTNTVNAVKEQFYDQPLQVNWTMRMVNGEMKLYATTNVNMSVLQ